MLAARAGPSQRRRRRRRIRSDGEASGALLLLLVRGTLRGALMHGARRLKISRDCCFRSRHQLDGGGEAKFPAFRCFELVHVACTDFGRKRLECILPERRDEMVMHGEPPLR